MGCCCGKTAAEDALLPSTDTKRNERVIISSRSPSKNHTTGGKEEGGDTDDDYEPPSLPENQRLSLPYSPAQKDGKKINITKHRKKSGFVKKKGHLVKNWKRRYLVLKGDLTPLSLL